MTRSLPGESRRALTLSLATLFLFGCSADEAPMEPESASTGSPGVSANGAPSVSDPIDLGIFDGEASQGVGVNNDDWMVVFVVTGFLRGHSLLLRPGESEEQINPVTTVPNAINNNGLTGGFGGGVARVWSLSGAVNLDMSTSRGFGLNDGGVVVGEVQGTFTNAARWVPDGAGGWNRDFFDGSATSTGLANDISNGGWMVGRRGPPGQPFQAVLWTPNLDLREFLTDLSGHDDIDGTDPTIESEALAINEYNQVVGWSEPAGGGPEQPVVWTEFGGNPDVIVKLETLPVTDRGVANDISDNGIIVGNSETSSGTTTATLWALPDLTPVHLGGAPGYDESVAVGINDAGTTIIGTSVIDGVDHATVWHVDAGPAPEPTPEEIVDLLDEAIDELVDSGSLNKGQGNSLHAKVRSARKSLAKGKNKTAANQLNALINQLNALVNGGVLTAGEAQPLIDLVQSAIDQLEA